jgi:hypothetical protein
MRNRRRTLKAKNEAVRREEVKKAKAEADKKARIKVKREVRLAAEKKAKLEQEKKAQAEAKLRDVAINAKLDACIQQVEQNEEFFDCHVNCGRRRSC